MTNDQIKEAVAKTAVDIDNVMRMLTEFLLEKNEAYGDSALSPVNIFATTDSIQQLHLRIDDKIKRLTRGKELPDESFDDTIRDLIGYLVLWYIARQREQNKL